MNSNLLGAYGEHLAARFLRKKKYDILAANFKTYNAEIDLIVRKKDVLCFVEVKTRQVGGMLPPAEAVDIHKQENIKSCAAVYINRYAPNTQKTRYDIIEVLVDGMKQENINHIENAF